MEEIPEHSRSRNKIENELIIKHKALQRKIDALKVRRYKEEIQHNQSVPTINSRSRRLAKSSEKSPIHPTTQQDRAHELFLNSRFFPRKAKISLMELAKSLSQTTLPRPQLSNSPSHLHSPMSILSITTCNSDPLIKFPSLLYQSKQINESKSSSSILSRNKLLASLREETTNRGFLTEPEEPPSILIHERNQIWLNKRNEKISELREKQENKTLISCTFRPDLQGKKFFSLNNSLRSSSAETSYASLFERKKRLRSTSKTSGVESMNRRLNESNSISSMNSFRLKEKILNNFSPAYSSLCPVALSLSHAGFKDSKLKIQNKKKFIKFV